jgi:hypothetical protein
MEFRKSKPVSLKTHDTYNEKWLQAQIAEDPGLLGLGDLIVKDIERRQPRAGRLDLLLSDPETHTRYEVEIQLGATDESHIIRTIEYWDIEKSRYPQYEHVAVIVAEDITSRFLNVINLFNKAIPLIAIQLRALDVGGVLTISATTVLDLVRVGTEASVAVADQILALVNEITPGMALKYNKHYVGLTRDGIVDNFLAFRPRRESAIVDFRIPRGDEITALIDDSGVDSLEYDKRYGQYRLRLTTKDVTAHRDLLLELVRRASKTPPPIEE